MKKEEITLKNTKAEILEALNEALEREKNIAQMKYEPEKEEKKQKVEKVIEETRVNVEQKIFSEELNKKFQNLEIAIQEEERKLKELYGIEKELNNLVIVVNAGKDYMAELENNKKRRTEEITEEIKNLEEEYKVKKEELEKEYETEAKAECMKELEKEYTRGKKEATAEIEKENKYTIELLKKDYESTIERQNDKILILKEEIEKTNAEKIAMQEKLDQAYNQIKEMATKTVEATGGVKILGNNGNDIKA